jgi:class 3 adenylate cyclase
MPSLEKRLGENFEVFIGIHVGGPVAAGVMSILRPVFQMVGPVFDVALQIMESGLPGHIYISRTVFELVFTSGFSIQEKGDVDLRSGGSVFSYVLR